MKCHTRASTTRVQKPPPPPPPPPAVAVAYCRLPQRVCVAPSRLLSRFSVSFNEPQCPLPAYVRRRSARHCRDNRRLWRNASRDRRQHLVCSCGSRSLAYRRGRIATAYLLDWHRHIRECVLAGNYLRVQSTVLSEMNFDWVRYAEMRTVGKSLCEHVSLNRKREHCLAETHTSLCGKLIFYIRAP